MFCGFETFHHCFTGTGSILPCNERLIQYIGCKSPPIHSPGMIRVYDQDDLILKKRTDFNVVMVESGGW